MKNINKSLRTFHLKSYQLFVMSLLFGLSVIFVSPHSLAACANTPGTTLGTDTMSISVPSAGTYYDWVRLKSTTAANDNIYMQIDGGCAASVGGGSAIPVNTWTWVNYQNGTTSSVLSQALTAGTHSIVLTGQTSGVIVDQVLLLSDPSCIPSDATGSNCQIVNTAPTVSLSSPTNGSSVQGNVTVSATAAATTNGASVTSVQFQVDGQNVGTAVTTSPYSYTWDSTKTTNSNHTVSAVATDSNNMTATASVSVTVNNPVQPPTTPTNVSAVANSSNSATVSWSASSDGTGPGIGGYYILEGSSSSNIAVIASVNASTTSFKDATLSPNTTYYYAVEAFDASTVPNVSSPSTVVSVTTLNIPPPTIPTNVQAVANTATSVTVSWSPSTDTGGPGVGGYYVIRDGVNITPKGVISTQTTYNDTSVVANTTYTYTVESFDTMGNVSNPSIAATVTTPNPTDSQAPTQPTGLSGVLVSTSQINLSWVASSDNVGVAGYYVYRGGNKIATVTSGTSYGDTTVTTNTSYNYYVIAFDGAGNKSTASTTVTVSTSTVPKAGTLQGVVTAASTGKALGNVYVRSGKYGSLNGMVFTYSNAQGQYLLSGLTANKVTYFAYSLSGYKNYSGNWFVPVGTLTKNVSMVAK